jgi:hypothetical protein
VRDCWARCTSAFAAANSVGAFACGYSTVTSSTPSSASAAADLADLTRSAWLGGPPPLLASTTTSTTTTTRPIAPMIAALRLRRARPASRYSDI